MKQQELHCGRRKIPLDWMYSKWQCLSASKEELWSALAVWHLLQPPQCPLQQCGVRRGAPRDGGRKGRMLHNLQGFEAQVCFQMTRCADRCWSLWWPRFISITCSRSLRHLSLLHIEPAGGHNNMFHYKTPAHTLDLSFYNHTQYVIVHLPRAEQTPSVQLSTYLPDPQMI